MSSKYRIISFPIWYVRHKIQQASLTLVSPEGTSWPFAISSSFISLAEQYFRSLSLIPQISWLWFCREVQPRHTHKQINATSEMIKVYSNTWEVTFKSTFNCSSSFFFSSSSSLFCFFDAPSTSSVFRFLWGQTEHFFKSFFFQLVQQGQKEGEKTSKLAS